MGPLASGSLWRLRRAWGWNVDPVMVQIGPLAIRWYGVLLTLAIFLGYELARRRLRAWGWDLGS